MCKSSKDSKYYNIFASNYFCPIVYVTKNNYASFKFYFLS